jgi:hypothetical protein
LRFECDTAFIDYCFSKRTPTSLSTVKTRHRNRFQTLLRTQEASCATQLHKRPKWRSKNAPTAASPTCRRGFCRQSMSLGRGTRSRMPSREPRRGKITQSQCYGSEWQMERKGRHRGMIRLRVLACEPGAVADREPLAAILLIPSWQRAHRNLARTRASRSWATPNLHVLEAVKLRAAMLAVLQPGCRTWGQ